MCGIAGVFPRRPSAAEPSRARAEAMANALAQCRPDGSGVWGEAEVGLALAHRRLAVIDLSPGGAQPMRSACGRYAITYNGELYDYRDHRAALRAHGVEVPGESDTAVLLVALAAWGVEAALSRVDAMFAFALWDGPRRTLWLARDHAGIKPLYCCQCADGTILFSSELRALEAAGGLSGAIDPESAFLFLRLGRVPSPRAILAGVHQVPPGGLLRIPLARTMSHTRWFDIVALARDTPRAALSPDEAAEAVDAVLEPSVRRLLAALLRASSERFWNTTVGWLPGAPRRPGETLSKVARVLAARHLDEAYGRLVATDGAPPLPTGLPEEPLLRFRAANAVGYLPDDVLTKVDRAVRRAALKVRVPILSPAMIRLACSLALALLVRADGGKAVLRDALARHLPRHLFEREKTGFSPPLAAWLRGPLRGWAADLLHATRLRTSGFVDPARLDAAWALHGAGRDCSARLWPALMLSASLEARAAR